MAKYIGPQVVTADGLSTYDSDRVGKGGERVMTPLHGSYYEQSSRGNTFFGTSASTGIALIVPATTGGHPTLWNPLGSGKNLSIIRLELSYVSGNANPIGSGSQNPVGVWSPTTNTFTAAPVFIRPTGLSLFTGVAATAVAPFQLVANYDGDFVIAPGVAISLCSQAATTTALFQVCVVWEEAAP